MPADEHVTRCDLRIPNELYGEIESLAVANGAGNHHRSGKPIVTPTILELIRAGLARHNGGELPDKLPDKVADSYLIDEKIEAAIAPLRDELTKLKEAIENKPIDPPQTKATSQPTQIDTPPAVGSPMPLEQAFQLVQSRDFNKSRDTFRKNVRKPDRAEEYAQKYGIRLGEYNEYFDLWASSK